MNPCIICHTPLPANAYLCFLIGPPNDVQLVKDCRKWHLCIPCGKWVGRRMSHFFRVLRAELLHIR